VLDDCIYNILEEEKEKKEKKSINKMNNVWKEGRCLPKAESAKARKQIHCGN